jgi:hypothetical protein
LGHKAIISPVSVTSHAYNGLCVSQCGILTFPSCRRSRCPFPRRFRANFSSGTPDTAEGAPAQWPQGLSEKEMLLLERS